MQELTCSFFLPPQPYCLKKNSWGRINQNPQTPGEAKEPAKAESSQTVAGPPQPRAPQLLVLNLSHCSFLSRTLQQHSCSFSLQHLTSSSYLEGLIPVDSALPNQRTQQKSFNQHHIFYQILLILSTTSSFPIALSK